MDVVKGLITCLVLCFSAHSFAAITIRSAVAPEFTDGLHSRYLIYISHQMAMPLDIQPMPLARRLKQLQAGHLDILVGVINRADIVPEFIYLQPAYESLVSHFFILKSNRDKLSQFSDLQQMVIGTTTNAKYFQQFQQQQELSKIEVSTLTQKIQLLQKGRVDTFLHYKQSTLPLLASMGLEQQVVLAPYQPEFTEKHYFVISPKSRLLPYKNLLQNIIAQGVQTGAFHKIRREYYQKKQ